LESKSSDLATPSYLSQSRPNLKVWTPLNGSAPAPPARGVGNSPRVRGAGGGTRISEYHYIK